MAWQEDGESRCNTEAKSLYEPKTKADLEALGKVLDEWPPELDGRNHLMKAALENLRVRTRVGGIRHLDANRVQASFEEARKRQNIILKGRQMGLTTWVAARFFLRTITQPGTLTLQVAHTQPAAEEIFRIVHRFYQHLSDDLRKGPLKTSRANVRQLVFPEMDSQYRVESAADPNAGRGMTAQNLHCSEVSRWPGNPAETLAGLRASLSPQGELVIESTPRGMGDCFHTEWVSAPQTGLVRHFFPWWLETSYTAEAVDAETLTEEERELMARERLSLEQIAYRRQIHANFHGLARQEYAEDPESCFLASGDLVFEMGPVETRLKHLHEPVIKKRNGELLVWLPPQPGKRYVVAVDPAGGGADGDNSVIEVVDAASSLQCAEFAGHLGGLQLAQLAADIAHEYNDAWLVVERNNHGSGILELLARVCQYERIYEDTHGKAGWLTSSFSKPVVIDNLGAILVKQPDLFQSKGFLGECRSYVRLPNGGTGAKAGTHDDRVMALAIALAARTEILERRL